MTWYDFDDIREVEAVRGCFALVRKKALEQIGLMDDIYFVYGDDIDWCYRFRRAGWKVTFTPEPVIIHYLGQTTKQMYEEFLLQLHASKLIFMKKFRSRYVFPLACFLTALFFLSRVPYWLWVGILNKEERNQSLLPAKTYLRGGIYCLIGWRNLLMNKETIKGKL